MLGHLVSSLPPAENGGLFTWLRSLLMRLRLR
jgi:hypothetical protein